MAVVKGIWKFNPYWDKGAQLDSNSPMEWYPYIELSGNSNCYFTYTVSDNTGMVSFAYQTVDGLIVDGLDDPNFSYDHTIDFGPEGQELDEYNYYTFTQIMDQVSACDYKLVDAAVIDNSFKHIAQAIRARKHSSYDAENRTCPDHPDYCGNRSNHHMYLINEMPTAIRQLTDVSDSTVTSNTLLAGEIAYDASGTKITGSYSVDSVQRAPTTLTIPAGTSTSFTATASNNQDSGLVVGSNQTASRTVYLRVSGKTVEAASATSGGTVYGKASVASGSATTPATTIKSNPTISVSSAGVITASVSATKSVTPTVSAGYVSSGTAGTITVSGSGTKTLSTQAAETITPTSRSQTAVAAGKYTTGAVTVAAVPTETKETAVKISGTTITPSSGKFLSEVKITGWSTTTSVELILTPGSYYTGVTWKSSAKFLAVVVSLYIPDLSSSFIELPPVELVDVKGNNRFSSMTVGNEYRYIIGTNGYATYLCLKKDSSGNVSFKIGDKAYVVSAASTSLQIKQAKIKYYHNS